MAEGMEFLLEVPVDALQVSEFKPNHPVKVFAYARRGEVKECVVNLNAEAKATVSFKFNAAPEPVKIALGPETVSARELTDLQTISVDVPAASWVCTSARISLRRIFCNWQFCTATEARR